MQSDLQMDGTAAVSAVPGNSGKKHGVQTPTNHPGALGPAAPNSQTNHTHPAYG